MTPVKALGFFWAAVAYASLEACQPIQIGFNGSLYVPGLGCHSACGSAASINPAYSLQPDSSDTWASHASAVSAPADLAVLDLCNQVQSIWLMQGRPLGGPATYLARMHAACLLSPVAL